MAGHAGALEAFVVRTRGCALRHKAALDEAASAKAELVALQAKLHASERALDAAQTAGKATIDVTAVQAEDEEALPLPPCAELLASRRQTTDYAAKVPAVQVPGMPSTSLHGADSNNLNR